MSRSKTLLLATFLLDHGAGKLSDTLLTRSPIKRSVPDVVNDYIVVGGGVRVPLQRSTQTAGLVVAARLSEDPTVSVLVLETGRANLNHDSISAIPPFSSFPLSRGAHFFRGFMTVPQKHNNGTSFYWPRAKGLGGASGINFYVFTQPPASDIDVIEKLGIRPHLPTENS
ncbi:GMC oxidoreductase-domain-containing protein [Russula earlei]|uniref:GMC oxidoreductase-domain-containing protein n=1 Tax=Russula earlei TaxID=71964 RepID=A0ACC0UI46_9AGAM|nr:GMC oxidoreductase-domain-containing protein [Russula earlei]